MCMANDDHFLSTLQSSEGLSAHKDRKKRSSIQSERYNSSSNTFLPGAEKPPSPSPGNPLPAALSETPLVDSPNRPKQYAIATW